MGGMRDRCISRSRRLGRPAAGRVGLPRRRTAKVPPDFPPEVLVGLGCPGDSKIGSAGFNSAFGRQPLDAQPFPVLGQCLRHVVVAARWHPILEQDHRATMVTLPANQEAHYWTFRMVARCMADSELEGRPLGWASTALMPGAVFQLIGPPIVGFARRAQVAQCGGAGQSRSSRNPAPSSATRCVASEVVCLPAHMEPMDNRVGRVNRFEELYSLEPTRL